MNRIIPILLLIMSSWAVVAEAVDAEDFTIKTTEDLVALCGVSADDPEAVAAIHFCHGFAVGAYHFYRVTTEPSSPREIVCIPESPRPSRNQIIADFVTWAADNQQYMQDEAVDTLFRFLEMKFPCAK